MAKNLVIVESPAKAKTIAGYLGSDYEVAASVGHIRDLPLNGKDLPEELRKKWWADYAVDVDNNFEPIYEVPSGKAAQVKKLKDALKGKDTLVLATDEDREGESISWHLLQVLKPGRGVEVKRIAFHEITKEAIRAALANPRKIDEALVDAQETRRILDRLYGYTLSPVLWSRVMRNLSAGRVQTPAVKLIVDREKARRRFKSSAYWDLKADLEAAGTGFAATLRTVDAVRVATGADFDDETGELKKGLKGPRVILDEAAAAALAASARASAPWTVTAVEETEGAENPAPPFMTTTLQQDANRKFGFSADRTMRVAQTLYEGVDIGGEQVGLITYMRTDSLTLASEAITRIRGLLEREYADCLPERPRHYTSKVRNAQEAHEAIRPTDVNRRPTALHKHLSDDQFKLYDLIWKRAVASQMKSARVLKTEADIAVSSDGKALGFVATGKQVLFDGYQRLYTEGADEPEGDADGAGGRLPRLTKGLELKQNGVTAQGHATKPPARYTDATLIKKLEENGIGRPSTYASIISVIVDRGYVRKSGKQLVPFFKAFLTMEVLEGNFGEFTDLDFTRNMDDELDEIANGKADSKEYLNRFFLGEKGLKTAVDGRKRDIPYPAFSIGSNPETGEELIVRIGTSGNAFLQQGPRELKKFANVPEDLAPADLTLERALELFEGRQPEAESIGNDPVTGRRLLLKNRQGYYLEIERTPEEIEAKERPRWVSLPPGADPYKLSQIDLEQLCSLPRTIGRHPELNVPVLYKMGKYGGYIEAGEERRTLEDWRAGLTITLDDAVQILTQPKYQSARREAAAPIQEFGILEGAAGPVKILSGRFGPYVTDGTTNATLPRGTDPATFSPERAQELLSAKRLAGPSTRPSRFVKRGAKKPAKKSPTRR
ncbi:MAG: type I DNA topoisomerase [Fimbriimonadaceae bacterium]